MVKVEKLPTQTITIGTKSSDAELIDKVLAYQKDNNFKNAADAVRSLCEIALDFKRLTKK